MGMIELTLGQARATLLPERGGLLSSLVLVADGKPEELLWMPPDFAMTGSGWPGGGAPFLFPFAGRVFLAEQPFRYEIGGQKRDMPLHGFGFAASWGIREKSAASTTLTLQSSAISAALFPFDFECVVEYTLAASDRLQITIEVQSESNEPMPLAFGLHPYFRLAPGHRAQCELLTSARERLAVTPSGGAGKAEPWPPGRVTLDEPDTANVILGKHAEPWIAFTDHVRGRTVRVGWDDPRVMQYAVLWSKREPSGQLAPFHCLEPWMGLPDAVATGAGSQWLAKGESLRVGLEIRLS